MTRIKRDMPNSSNRQGEHRNAANSNVNRPTQYQSAESSGREWGDHKYTDKVKTKTGKIRYIYDDTASTGGNNSHGARPITGNALRYAKYEFEKGKTEIGNAVNNAKESAMRVGHKIDKALWDAAGTITQTTTPSVNPTASGSNYVNKQMKKAENIPVSSLFK